MPGEIRGATSERFALLDLLKARVSCEVRFVVDSELAWQARSLFALERLAGSLVRIVPR
jgi:hypothetical protein